MEAVLVLAGIELVSFRVASMGLCFGFVLETVLITQGCVSSCWAGLTQRQGLCCCSHLPTSEEAGGARGAGRGHSRDSCPQLTPGMFQTIWRRAQHRELGEEGGRGGCWEWRRLSAQVTVTCDGALLSWRWLDTCLPWEVLNEFLGLLCLCAWLLLYLLNCLYLNPWVFSLLCFQFSPPSHWGEVSEQLCGA